jgi:dephospho-CoA kinase
MMRYVLGLTGSIGMGKSTAAQMFRDAGVPVWDADATVHRLYAAGGAAVTKIAKLVPPALAADGSVDRAALRAEIAADPALLDRISAIVHPLVAQERAAFLESHPKGLVVLDVPLLFETGGDQLCDGVAVVSVPADVQAERVLARGMTQSEFQMILNRQMPDAQKRAKANFVIDSRTMDGARECVAAIVSEIGAQNA